MSDNRIFALVDGNNFYASCERVFAPQLEGKPLIPCYLLQGVDDLWKHYSLGRLGLSAQASVMAEQKWLASYQVQKNEESAKKLAAALGWNRHDPYNPAWNGADPRRLERGFYPFDMGYSYSTAGSGYNREWRFHLNPICGFN
jgi:hypothetical protein